ncbi:MAG: hypothetical protein AABY62_05390 [Pseudomonadota bacterium]
MAIAQLQINLRRAQTMDFGRLPWSYQLAGGKGLVRTPPDRYIGQTLGQRTGKKIPPEIQLFKIEAVAVLRQRAVPMERKLKRGESGWRHIAMKP